ncbi:MAG TPA: 3'(2'),5'-bisphosphate nucleotidase CysQ [Terriglobia bacterium]|nr:3'(2'),5'-bisphosphate nucleotidase CysQ [Terriglobia bacterium]
MTGNAKAVDLVRRIEEALDAAAGAISAFIPGKTQAQYKVGDDPVTAADHAANRVLREILVRGGEGWLSEESVDDPTRLERERVWVVDPLDGTREFVDGIPEWCISVGFVERGQAVAGGILNPVTAEKIVGSRETGVTYNGKAAQPSQRATLAGALVLGSRSEAKRGEWKRFEGLPFTVRNIGSVAYKLGLVAAGKADATWTLVPKNEWDVAAGTALVLAAGGFVRRLEGEPPTFNNPATLMTGLIAGGPNLRREIDLLLEDHHGSPAVR